MADDTIFEPGELVVSKRGNVYRHSSQGPVPIRRANEEEKAAYYKRKEEAQAAQAARLKRAEEQDWRDANRIQSAFEHNFEQAIAVIGADVLRGLAQKLEDNGV